MADEDITSLLKRLHGGDDQARDALVPLVYDELHRIARIQRSRWVGDETLSATVLVHEAYERLVEVHEGPWTSREHFYGVASRAMRNLLVNYAQRRRALKRGGGAVQADGDEPLVDDAKIELVLAVHEALEKLAARSSAQARLVEYRFFGGMKMAEIADLLGVTERTIRREWTRARAWLAVALGESDLSQMAIISGVDSAR